MKKLVLSALAVCALSGSAFAQQEVKFGPKAGVNFANLSNLDDSEMKIGFHVGAVAEIKFNDKFSIQPELLYSAQGTKYTYPFLGQDIEMKFSLDYVNIPIMAKYYIVDGFSVEAGPQVGFLVKAEAEVEGGNMSGTTDVKDNVKSVDFGVNFGVAYDLPNGFFVNARYNLGLAKLDDSENLPNNVLSLSKDSKNSVIQVGVGYKF